MSMESCNNVIVCLESACQRPELLLLHHFELQKASSNPCTPHPACRAQQGAPPWRVLGLAMRHSDPTAVRTIICLLGVR